MACADITRDSDELTEMYCEHCDKDGTTVTADGFCVDCTEYMCSICLKYHKKYVPSHTYQDKSNMPQDFCFLTCFTHPNELLKFYCSTCDVTTCPDCRSCNHQSCGSNVGHIPTLVQSTEYLNELKELKKTMNEMADDAVVIKEDTDSKLKKVLSNRIEVLTAIDKHQKEMKTLIEFQRKEIVDTLDLQKSWKMGILDQKQRQLKQQYADVVQAMDKEMAEIIRKHEQKQRDIYQQHVEQVQALRIEKAEAIREIDEKQSQRKNQLQKEKNQQIQKIDEEIEKLNKQTRAKGLKLQNLVSNSKKILFEVEQLKSDIERKDSIGQKCELFVVAKQAKHDVTRLNKDMHKVREECEVTFYEFKPEKNIINIDSPGSSIFLGCLKDKLAFVSEFSTPTDHWCRITGLCKTDDSHLIAVDFQDHSVSLIDITSNECVFELHLHFRPFGVTKVGTNQFAVTIPNPGKIKFLSITRRNTLSVDREISVDCNCHGIIHYSDSLVVLYRRVKQVRILDMNGLVLKQFSTDSSPISIALSPVSNSVYIGDDDGSVQCMELNGTLIYKSTISTGISTRYNVCALIISAVDMLGTVYLSNGKTLYQVSADLSTIRELLILESTVHSLHYCNQENKLYVGMWGNSRKTIKVYQVS